ncbi:MAG: response regulator [Leptospiraceae bacterium]|nr:response regulator [Leptospiraceae bacterium]
MSKKVLDVGQCNPDHMAIRSLMESFGAEVHRVALPSQAMELLEKESFDLVLVNRKIDQDYTDGAELIKMMKARDATRSIPVMLVSNLPEAQKEAVALGAEKGFGKDYLRARNTIEMLQPYLGQPVRT